MSIFKQTIEQTRADLNAADRAAYDISVKNIVDDFNASPNLQESIKAFGADTAALYHAFDISFHELTSSARINNEMFNEALDSYTQHKTSSAESINNKFNTVSNHAKKIKSTATALKADAAMLHNTFMKLLDAGYQLIDNSQQVCHGKGTQDKLAEGKDYYAFTTRISVLEETVTRLNQSTVVIDRMVRDTDQSYALKMRQIGVIQKDFAKFVNGT